MIPKHTNRQRGATMVVALIMLVLLTLFAISAMNASNTSLRIASNTQTRNEVIAAVQQEIDKAMSVAFTSSPALLAAVAGPKPVDINNDGVIDYNVIIGAPTCSSSVPIVNGAWPPTDKQGEKCRRPSADNPGNISFCSNTRWDIGASATDPVSGATVTIHQGVGVRVLSTSC